MLKKTTAIIVMFLTAAALLASCMKPIELQEGERYFEGSVAHEYAESCEISFVLSADGKSVRDVRVVTKGLDYKGKYQDASYDLIISENVGTSTHSFSGGKLDENGSITLGTSKEGLRLTVTGNSASGDMDYVYKSKPGKTPSFTVLVGTYPFTAEDRTEQFNASKEQTKAN